MTNVTSEREPLSRESILVAAVALADAGGVGKLSMRSLARDLGYEVMSLYNHVANKGDLLAGMVEHVAGEIPTPEPYGDPLAAVRLLAVEAREALVRHPWAAGLWQDSLPASGRLRFTENLLAAFAASELSDEVAHHGYHAVTNHVLGYTLQSQAMNIPDESLTEAEMMQSFLDGVDDGRFPHTVAHVRQHMAGETGPSFELVLDLILDGLRSLPQ